MRRKLRTRAYVSHVKGYRCSHFEPCKAFSESKHCSGMAHFIAVKLKKPLKLGK